MKYLTPIYLFCLMSTITSQNLVKNGDFEDFYCEFYPGNSVQCMNSWEFNGHAHDLVVANLLIAACTNNSKDGYLNFSDECYFSGSNRYKFNPELPGVVYPVSGENIFEIPYSLIRKDDTVDIPEVIDLKGQFKSPLERNKLYYFSFHIALHPFSSYMTDNLNVYAGYRDSISFQEMELATNESTLAYSHPKGNYINNYDNWITLSSCFKAEGNEQFLYFDLRHPQDGTSRKPIPSRVPVHEDAALVEWRVHHLYNFFIDDIRMLPLGKSEKTEIQLDYCSDENHIFTDSLLGLYDALIESANSIFWSDGIQGLERSFPSSGEYTLTIALDCAEKEFIVQVEQQDCRGKVYIPNVFSPNGDDINDVFKYHLENVQFESVEIYDRFGGLVFESHNPYHYWDGRSKGMLVNTGVYVYQLRFRDRTGELQLAIGSVTVLP